MERETTITATGNNRASNIKCVAKHVECIVVCNAKGNFSVTFAATVPVVHTIRTAYGSFFLYSHG